MKADVSASKLAEADAFAVEAGSAAPAAAGARRRFVGKRIRARAGHQVVVGAEQREDQIAAGVVGIREQHNRVLERYGQREKGENQLVELGAAVAVGPHDAFTDARR